MQTMNLKTLRPAYAGARIRTTRMTTVCRSSSSQQKNVAPSQEHTSSAAALSALTLAALPFAAPLTAFAEDAAPAAGEAVAAATTRGTTPLGIAVSAVPLAVYGAFYLYREKINPRAKIGDLLFAVAATAIIGNIISIVVFKIRFF